ncbi:MAG TPA: LacI family DNA-binding transcriptional regulator [Anaerolineaceae bacterium]|nr:LacI family DNA-binding transcriptional regulator [Anaerolineaceae bacterium]
MTLTLEDVAQYAGVSRSTVSRVINGDPNVNEKTRQKVKDVIQKLDFQPNLAARGLAAGHTNVLGLVIPMGVSAIFTDPYFPLVIQGVSSACNVLDYSVMLWLAEPEYERRTIRQILYNGLVDGVIVASMLLNDPIVESLAESKLPFILIGRHPTNNKISYVDVENRISARDAVLYLMRLGRRRIATISGPQTRIAGIDRYDGYVDALRERGITPDSDLVAEGDFTDAGGYFAMQRLLPHRPDAVFAASDMMAIGAMRAIQEAGLLIPEDIAVIGYDDIPLAARTSPQLTTVRQPILREGGMAAETLIDMIAHPSDQPRRIILTSELVIRSSCSTAAV